MLHFCLYMPNSAHFGGYTNFTTPSKWKSHIEPLEIVDNYAENISCLVYANINIIFIVLYSLHCSCILTVKIGSY